MADVSLVSFPCSAFYGDDKGIIDAGDLPATPDNNDGRAGIKFVDGSDEHAAVSYSFRMPSQYGGSNNLKVSLASHGDAAPGANNGVRWNVACEAITESDAHDLQGGGDYFAAPQALTGTVDANAGELNIDEITFTNAQADGVQPGDIFRLCIRRDSDHADDTYADSVWLLEVQILDVQ